MGGPGWGGAESPGKVTLGDRVKERHEEWRQVLQLLAQGMTYDPQICSWPFVGLGLGNQVHGNPQIPGIRGRFLGSATPCLPATPMQ